MVLPGGWKSTPGKRKRREHRSPQASDEPSARRAEVNNGRPWGVKEWKRLEKLYKVERAAWMEKRMIQPLPAAGSPFLKARAVEEWDAENVVNRFLKDERVVGDSNGEWDRYVETCKRE
jgi:hypothetical protein